MPDQPSTELMQLLGQLGLVGASELKAARRRVARLARGVPLFDSVWIDALVQTSALSLFQASLLHAGRGAELLVGDFTLVDRLHSLGSITTFQAQYRDAKLPVRLVIADIDQDTTAIQTRLSDLAERSKRIDCPHVAPVRFAQVRDRQAIVASDWIAGQTLAARLIRNGRFRACEVQGIAQQIVIALRSLDVAGLVHGDLSLRELSLADSGQVVLLAPGLRQCLRPHEGYAFAELESEAYATLSPERIRAATPASRADDVYALGVVCWHLLAGRCPFPVANSLATLRAIERGRIPDITRIALDVPAALARTVSACLNPEPEQRPQSFDDLESLLAAPRAVPSFPQARSTTAPLLTGRAKRSAGSHRITLPRLAIPAVGCLLLAGVVLLGIYYRQVPSSSTPAVARQTQTSNLSEPTECIPTEDVPELPIETGGSRVDVARTSFISPADAPPDLILPSDRPLYLKSISPRAGQRITGQAEKRPQIWLTQGALTIAVDDVHFDGVDFVWAPADEPTTDCTVVNLLAHRIAFSDCSFQSRGQLEFLPAIVATTEIGEATPLSLPTVICDFQRCVALDVDCLVHHSRQVALSTQLTDVLLLRSQGAVRVEVAPDRQSPLNLSMTRCTLREVATCISLPPIDRPLLGRVSVQSNHCVFSPAAGGTLLRLGGENGWRWLNEFDWHGQASIVAQQASLVAGEEAMPHADDRRLQITGLVRSQIEFAGSLDAVLAQSQVVGWSAPLLTPAPPGADVTVLTLPSLLATKPSSLDLTTPNP